MARQPQPWRRKDVDGGPWYGRIQGRKIFLAPGSATKTEAQGVLVKLLAEQAATGRVESRGGGYSTREVLDLFLTATSGAVDRGELALLTLAGYERYLSLAREALGHIQARDLRPAAITAWLDSRKGWGTTSRFNAITAVKRAFGWARREGHIDADPLADMARPTPQRRRAILDHGQVAAIFAALPEEDPFRDLLTALRETGARPGEVYGLTADRVDLDAGTWRVTDKVRRKTGDAHRTVYLSDAAVELSRRLVAKHPTGALFRNAKNRPWTRNAVAIRFGRLGSKLGIEAGAVAYSFRHLYVTDALERGVPPATVAELVGHRNLDMIARVYSRLKGRTSHLRDAARKMT